MFPSSTCHFEDMTPDERMEWELFLMNNEEATTPRIQSDAVSVFPSFFNY